MFSVTPCDYYIGEEFDLKNGAGFRRMDNPIADGQSPNCYTAGTKNLDVHYSSGVGNHFFFDTSEGLFAVLSEDVCDASPCRTLDGHVGVQQVETESRCDPAADRGLTGTRRSDGHRYRAGT